MGVIIIVAVMLISTGNGLSPTNAGDPDYTGTFIVIGAQPDRDCNELDDLLGWRIDCGYTPLDRHRSQGKIQ